MRSYNFAPRKEQLILAHLGRGWRGFREVVTFLSGERRQEWTLQEREESLLENNDGRHGNTPPRCRPRVLCSQSFYIRLPETVPAYMCQQHPVSALRLFTCSSCLNPRLRRTIREVKEDDKGHTASR